MKNIEPKILKGFRDFLPKEVQKRQYVINILKGVFESYGFEPLETPALEYEEVLLGKYGDEGDKLMYRFEDNGKRKVALRYDQTVPTARVIAQYQNELPMPFKRYQIQPVWRAENTQKGRFREFLQCDADIIGSSSPLSDAESIAVAAKAIEALGIKKYKIIINDRSIFQGISKEAIIVIDKLKKIDRRGVIQELIDRGSAKDKTEAASLLLSIEGAKKPERINEIFSALNLLGIDSKTYEFCPTLARGLDYYTGVIFEIEIEGYTVGSVLGGGRYDELIGMFAGRQIPAVGFAFGFDRLIEAMEELKLFPDNLKTTKVLVTVFAPELLEKSLQISSQLRSNNINTEVYLDENARMEKQLKYADQKGIPYAVIIGPDEEKNNTVTLKNLKTRKQQTISQDSLIKSCNN